MTIAFFVLSELSWSHRSLEILTSVIDLFRKEFYVCFGAHATACQSQSVRRKRKNVDFFDVFQLCFHEGHCIVNPLALILCNSK